MNGQNQMNFINVQEIRQKIGSKKELYDFLTQECNAYLPKLTCTNIYFLKSIINGEKEYLKRNEVTITAIPQIEGLTADDFIDFASQSGLIKNYLPDQCDWLHLDKRWICDVLMTLDKEGVSEMVKKAKENRRDKLNRNSNSLIQMRPEFIDALNNTMSFSQQRGRSAYLLKSGSQRKRRQKDMEEVKEEEVKLNQSKQKYLEQNKRVRNEIQSLQDQVEELHDYKNLVISLHQAGIINEDGNPIMNSSDFSQLNDQMS